MMFSVILAKKSEIREGLAEKSPDSCFKILDIFLILKINSSARWSDSKNLGTPSLFSPFLYLSLFFRRKSQKSE